MKLFKGRVIAGKCQTCGTTKELDPVPDITGWLVEPADGQGHVFGQFRSGCPCPFQSIRVEIEGEEVSSSGVSDPDGLWRHSFRVAGRVEA